MDDTRRIALVETRTEGEDAHVPAQVIRYQLGNHLGSVSIEIDGEARIISYEEYTPFGSTSYQAVRSQTQTPKRFRYSAMERDEESGLYYYGLRYYSPVIARWMNCDPKGIQDGYNSYEFVRGNPIRLIDPSGGSWKSFFTGIAVGVGTALVVAAVIATAPITIPASVAVGAVVVGVGVTTATVVQSTRQRDLFNNPISKDQADFQMGSALGGLVATPFSGPTSSGMSTVASEFSGSTLVPAIGPSLTQAAVAPVCVEVASGVTSTAAPLMMAMANSSSGGGGGDKSSGSSSSASSSSNPNANASESSGGPPNQDPTGSPRSVLVVGEVKHFRIFC